MALQIAGFEVPVGKTLQLEDPAIGYYAPFNPSSKVLPRGHQKSDGAAVFEVDTLFEKDQAIPLRDGVNIYVDIFRPVGGEKVPALIIWSPYGKTGNGPHGLEMLPGRFGVPKERLSGYEKFEGLCPAEWVARGFAIVNARSERRVGFRGRCTLTICSWLGEQDGRDGYDAIEHIAKLPWCSGKIGTAGNSWLAMAQYYIAAQQPPSLGAIAPWEGASDFYRDTLSRGGITYPYDTLWGLLQNTTVGRNGIEAVIDMIHKYPLYNEYWEDKRAKLDKITAPAYVLASYSSALHTTGSIRAFNDVSSKDKWLRIHPWQEWGDLYSRKNSDELASFFSYYLKDDKNDFLQTPRLRVSLLPFNKEPIENIVFSQYPVPEAKYSTFYLGPKGTLDPEPTSENGTLEYDGSYKPKQDDNDSEEILFSHKFTKPTWLVGYSWLVVHISCDAEDDFDVFVQIRKMDASGKILQHMNVPLKSLIPPVSSQSEVPNSCFLKYLGANGCLKASHAISKVVGTDSKLGDWPLYTHEKREAVPKGKIMRLEIPVWPTGITFEPGESLVVKISGHYMSMMELDTLAGLTHANEGIQTVHFGSQYDNYLVVPLLDPISS